MNLIKIISIFLFLYAKNAIGINYHWLQLAPEDEIWLRYVDDNLNECPQVIIDGKTMQMDEFNEKNIDFPLNCKLSLENNNLPKTILLNQEEIKINFDKNNIKKIAVIGDTGCRVHKFINQDCKNDWYFEKISNLLVEHNPDVIIHVGDYIYREHGYKDNWKTWQEEFFKPAENLLAKNIPFILVRGNHEDCKRNGNGWFNLFSLVKKKECGDYSPIYSININNIEFVVTDSTIEEKLLEDIDYINSQYSQKQCWILTHRPLVYYDVNGLVSGHIKPFRSLNDNIKMIISGHIHILEVIRSEHRIQLISGNSGTLLSNYHSVNSENSKKQYGFSIINFNDNNITITGYNKDNEEILKNIL
jgi:predicted phosphodiesterase